MQNRATILWLCVVGSFLGALSLDVMREVWRAIPPPARVVTQPVSLAFEQVLVAKTALPAGRAVGSIASAGRIGRGARLALPTSCETRGRTPSTHWLGRLLKLSCCPASPSRPQSCCQAPIRIVSGTMAGALAAPPQQ